jgi:hypothetical protein
MRRFLMETTSKVKNQYAYAWTDDSFVQSKYSLPLARTVTSYRGPRLKRMPPVLHEFDLVKTHLTFEQSGRYYDQVLKKDVSGRTLGLVGLVDKYSGSYPSPFWDFDCSTCCAAAIQRAFVKASDPYVHEIHQFGELVETVSALKSPLKGTRKLLKKVRELLKDEVKLKLPIKEAAGAYLEHLYGTMPAIDQAAMLGQTAGRILDNAFPEYRTCRGYHREETNVKEGFFRLFIAGSSRPIWNKRHTYYKYKSKVLKRAGAGIYVNNPRLRNSSSVSSLAAEGWELLPLSFLANMFVDLSSLLKECRPVAGQITGSWVTSVVDSTYQYTLDSVANCTTITPCVFTLHKTVVKRTVGITRTGKIHLGPGLDSIGKVISTAALGISLKK